MTPLLRILRGLAALALLLLGLVGIPIALILLGGNPVPAITWDGVREALLTRDDGTILVGLVTVVGWIAWGVFAVSVISELVALLSHQRIRLSLPGLAGLQRVAAALLVPVAAMVTAPQSVPQQPVVATPVTTAVPAVQDDGGPPVAPSAPDAVPVPAGQVHRVEPGDDLWSLAERYYGHGLEWRRIAAANPRLLTGGPDRLEPGWRLVIPDVDQPATGGKRTVTVRRGDTLSGIAERELGSTAKWYQLYRANRAQLSDPDEIPVGLQLVLPGTKRVDPATEKKSADPPDREEHKADPEPRPSADATPTAPPAPTAQPTPSAESAPNTEHRAASTADEVAPLVAVGSLLAAGLLEGLAWRRRVQLQTRLLGRRIAHPAPLAIPVAAALGRRSRPMSLRTLDRAVRAIVAHSRSTGAPPPSLELAFVGDEAIELVMAEETPDVPVGFTVRGRSWLVSPGDADYLASVPGIGESLRPWPALVTLGQDGADRQVLADLESLRILHLDPEPAFDAEGVLAALAVELSFSPWADEMILTLVGHDDRLPDALGKHNVTQTNDLDGLLDRLEQRAAMQREHRPYATLSQHRVDPDLADPWAPEIVLINEPIGEAQYDRLTAVLHGEPRVTMAAVVVAAAPAGRWALTAEPDRSGAAAVLQPQGLSLTPQRLAAPELEAVLELVDVTGSDRTTAAPWWSPDDVPPGRPPDNVAYLDRHWAAQTTEAEREVIMRLVEAAGDPAAVHHPTLLLLGPVELVGWRGQLPPRAAKQCLEYCAWLLEHPGTTPHAMVSALAVAEGTRRSNMSRLRSWLGESPEGEQYLPDAYTGRITLHPSVSSDWHQLQLLTLGGVNRTGDDRLRAALELVRGAPLADAAPGQWHWAEELRTDMISCVRDIGVELTDRALLAGDIDLARWAAARALVTAPGDELLLAARIRTEHQAGNSAETERLSRQLTAQARILGVDLNPETVNLLQQVLEGRVRARLA